MTARIDRDRAALIIQDMQNDAFAEGARSPARERLAMRPSRTSSRTADACRCLPQGGRPGHPRLVSRRGRAKGLKLDAPMFPRANAHVKGSWGAELVPGLERQPGDLLVEKIRMSAWQDTILESLLRRLDRDQVIVTGAWTNMSIEHTAPLRRGHGLLHVRARGLPRDEERRLAQRIDQLRTQNVSTVTTCHAVVAAIGASSADPRTSAPVGRRLQKRCGGASASAEQ
jgi:gluconolactonase